MTVECGYRIQAIIKVDTEDVLGRRKSVEKYVKNNNISNRNYNYASNLYFD